MEEKNKVGAEKDLYSEEEILEYRSKEKIFLLVNLGLLILIPVELIFLPVVWWIKAIIFLVLGIAIWVLTGKIIDGINWAKDASAEDAIFRALSTELEITAVKYSRRYGAHDYLRDVEGVIGRLGFGFINHAKISRRAKGMPETKPRLHIVGKYKGLEFSLMQYKNYIFNNDKNKSVLSKDESWSEAMNFMKVKLPNDFNGFVEIIDKSMAPKDVLDGVFIETDDILFNKSYKVLSDDQLGGFIFMNPRHIVKIHDFAKALDKNKWASKFVLLFMNGFFYTQNSASTEVNISAPAKKMKNIKKAKKKCEGISQFVKTYIDGLDLDTEDYTNRRKGA